MEMIAVGRMRRTAEAEIVSRYLDRAEKTGRAIGLSGFTLMEIDESRAAEADLRKVQEAERLLAASTQPGRRIVLDETGKALTSEQLADMIGRWRDDGAASASLFLGGPDGHAPAMRDEADLVLNLGRITLPHLLARAVAAEQLYRIATILSGHPYHRA